MKTTNFDTSALRTRILDQGTITAFAARVGMSPRALGRRLAGKVEFSHDEIFAISAALDLDKDGIDRCFFTPSDLVEIADAFLKMTDKKKTLFLEILNMMNTPARQEFAAAWKGRMKDLPAALAQI